MWVSGFESHESESLSAALHCQVETFFFFYTKNKNKREKTLVF